MNKYLSISATGEEGEVIDMALVGGSPLSVTAAENLLSFERQLGNGGQTKVSIATEGESFTLADVKAVQDALISLNAQPYTTAVLPLPTLSQQITSITVE